MFCKSCGNPCAACHKLCYRCQRAQDEVYEENDRIDMHRARMDREHEKRRIRKAQKRREEKVQHLA